MRVVLIDIPTIPREPEAPYRQVMTEKYRLYGERLRSLCPSLGSRGTGRFFTYGLLSLAAGLPDADFRYFHYTDLADDSLLEAAICGECIVALTCLTPGYGVLRRLTRRIRRLNRGARLVAGGYHVSNRAQEVLVETPELDAVVKGPGVGAFREVVGGMPLQDIPGVTTRWRAGFVSNPPAPTEAIFPARYDVLPGPLQQYDFNVFASQGCSFGCAFCANPGFWGTRTVRPIADVCAELAFLSSILPAGSPVHFADNVFGVDRKYYSTLLEAIIRADLPLKFSCDSRAGCLDAEMVSLMQRAGFVKVSLGFEDSSQQVLQLASKGCSLDDCRETAALIRRHSGMIIEAYWLVGLPGYCHAVREHNKVTLRTLLDERTIDIVATSLKYVPLPGTAVFDHPEKYGVHLFDAPPEEYARHRYAFTYELEGFSRRQLTDSLLEMDRFLVEYYSSHPARRS